jgi:transcriptional regulator with XRE-family HTH domain
MLPDDLDTPAKRIAYAIEKSEKTLEQLAEEIGCSHAALSQWQTGATNVANIKAGLLLAFSEKTGIDVRWLLTGDGPRVSRYIMRPEMQRIATALQVMERSSPLQIETVVRMVEAAAEPKK